MWRKLKTPAEAAIGVSRGEEAALYTGKAAWLRLAEASGSYRLKRKASSTPSYAMAHSIKCK